MSLGDWGQIEGGSALPVGLAVSHCEVSDEEGGILATFTWEAETPLPVITATEPVVALGQMSNVRWSVTNYGSSATDVNMTMESSIVGVTGFSTMIADFPTMDSRHLLGSVNTSDDIFLAGARIPVDVFSPDVPNNSNQDTLQVHLPSYGIQWPEWSLNGQYPVLNVRGNLVVVGDGQQIECYAGNVLQWTSVLDGLPISIAISPDTQWVATATAQSIYLFSATQGQGNVEHWWQTATALPYIAFSDSCLWTVSGNSILCHRLSNPQGLWEAISCPFTPIGFSLTDAGDGHLYFGLVAGDTASGTNGQMCLMDDQSNVIYLNNDPVRAYTMPVLGDATGDGYVDMYAQYQTLSGHAGLANITHSDLFDAYGFGWGDFTATNMTSQLMPYSISLTRRHDDQSWNGARISCGYTSYNSLGTILQNNITYAGNIIRLGYYVKKEVFVSGFNFTANNSNVFTLTEKSANNFQAYGLTGGGWTDIAGPNLFNFLSDSVLGPAFCWYDPTISSWCPAVPVKVSSNLWTLQAIGLSTSTGSDWYGYNGNGQNSRSNSYRGNGFWTDECMREGEVTVTFVPAEAEPTLNSYLPMYINCCFPDSHIIGVEIQRWGAVEWIPDTTIWGESFNRAQYRYLFQPIYPLAQYRAFAYFGSSSPVNNNDGSNLWGQH